MAQEFMLCVQLIVSLREDNNCYVVFKIIRVIEDRSAIVRIQLLVSYDRDDEYSPRLLGMSSRISM